MVVEQVEGAGSDAPDTVADDVRGTDGSSVSPRPWSRHRRTAAGAAPRRRERQRRAGGRRSPNAAKMDGQVPASFAERGGELAERVIGSAWRCGHLGDTVDGQVARTGSPTQVVGRDPALPQRMRQPDPRHVEGREQAVRRGRMNAAATSRRPAGIDVGLARQLRSGECSGLARHRRIRSRSAARWADLATGAAQPPLNAGAAASTTTARRVTGERRSHITIE